MPPESYTLTATMGEMGQILMANHPMIPSDHPQFVLGSPEIREWLTPGRRYTVTFHELGDIPDSSVRGLPPPTHILHTTATRIEEDTP